MNKNLKILDEILFSNKADEQFKKYYLENSSFKKWLDDILPEIDVCKGQQQRTSWHIYNVLTHILKSVENMNFLNSSMSNDEKRLLNYTMFLHDLGKPDSLKIIIQPDGTQRDSFYGHAEKSEIIAERVLKYFDFKAKDIEKIKGLILYHDITSQIYDDKSTKKQNYYLDNDFISTLMSELDKYGDGQQMLNYLMLVSKSDNLAQNPQLTAEPLRIIDKIEKMNVNQISKRRDNVFEEMSDIQIYCFKKAINSFMKNFNINNYGVVINALEEFPDLNNKLMTLNSTKNIEFDELYYENFKSHCVEMNNEFERRYDLFYSYCVGDPVLSFDAKNTIGGSPKITKLIMKPKTKDFNDLCEQLENNKNSYSTNMKTFTEFLEDTSEVIKEAIDRCYERSYS